MLQSDRHLINPKLKALILVTLISGLFNLTKPTSAAVELVYFRGNFEGREGAVIIEWKTSYESRTAGYFIRRKLKGATEEPVTIPVFVNNQQLEFIPSAENGITGGDYEARDYNIIPGQEYEYSLWEQEFNNSEPTAPERIFQILATDEGTSTGIEPTPTPTVQAGSTNEPTQTPASSDPATSTPIGGSQSETTVTPAQSPTGVATTVGTVTVEPTASTDAQTEPTATTPPTPTASQPQPEPTQQESPSSPSNEDEQPAESSGGVAEAGELPQDEVYPEPGEGDEENDQDYVPPVPTDTPQPIDQDSVQQIGSGIEQNEQTQDNGVSRSNPRAIDQVSSEDVSRGRIVLWGGFLSSLLLFIAVAVATVYMYRQRTNKN